MKKKIINGLLLVAALVVASSSFVSCKDYEGDNYAQQQEELSWLQKALDAQVKAMADLSQIYYGKPAGESLDSQLKTLRDAGMITQNPDGSWTLNTTAKEKNDIADAIKDNNSALNGAVTQVITQYLQDHGLGAGSELDLSKYALKDNYYTKEQIDGMIPTVDLTPYLTSEKFTTEMKKYYTKEQVEGLQNAWQTAVFESETFKSLQVLAKNAQNQADKAVTDAANAQTTADEAKTAAANAQAAADKAKTAAETAQTKANEAFDKAVANAKDIKDLQDLTKALQEADKAMQEDIKKLQDQLADVQKELDNLDGRLKKLITDVEIQAAYNPVFGYINAGAFGINSRVLAANYGVAVNGVTFPTKDDNSYYNKVSVINEKEWNLIQSYLPAFEQDVNKFTAGQTIINDEEGNAGTLYLTVNPNDVDFEGTEFTLRTTNNQVSKVTLSPLEPSSEQLMYGYKRAQISGASQNGFYEAKATINFTDVKDLAPKYDMVQIAKDLKDAIDVNRAERTVDINFTSIAGTIYKNITNTGIPALGVNATWQDSEGFHGFVSKYELAGVAVKALDFGVIVDNVSLPKQWIDYVDGSRIDNEIREMIALELNIDPLQLGKIVVDPSTERIYVAITDKVTGENIKDDKGNDIVADITDQVNEIYTTLNTALQKYNDKVDDINKLPEQINKAVADMGTKMADNLSAFVNKYVNQVNKYIKKANSVINRAANLIQPVLLSTTTDGSFVQLSRLAEVPTQINDGAIIGLLPTTYTGEIVVPCYLKHLVVTNVFKGQGRNDVSAVNGDGGCVEKLGVANTNIQSKNLYKNPGEWAGFNADGLGGYTYEITYTAMDYAGKVSGKKYYVYVK